MSIIILIIIWVIFFTLIFTSIYLYLDLKDTKYILNDFIEKQDLVKTRWILLAKRLEEQLISYRKLAKSIKRDAYKNRLARKYFNKCIKNEYNWENKSTWCWGNT
jgi:hypothetical protein